MSTHALSDWKPEDGHRLVKFTTTAGWQGGEIGRIISYACPLCGPVAANHLENLPEIKAPC